MNDHVLLTVMLLRVWKPISIGSPSSFDRITGIIADGSSNWTQLSVRGYSSVLIRMRAHVCMRLANYAGAIENIVLWIGGYGGPRAGLDLAVWTSGRARNQTQLVDSVVCDWGTHVSYSSVSQPLWDRGPINSFFIRRGPGPNKFTRKYLSIFLSSYIKLT